MEDFGAEAAHFSRKNFYIDHGLKSCSTVEEETMLVSSVKEMHQKAGFTLQKFWEALQFLTEQMTSRT